MFKDIISSKKYWVSVCVIGLVFILILSVVEHVMEFGGLAWDQFLQQKILYGQWKKYVISRLVGALTYGMIMSYYVTMKKIKANKL